MRIRTDPDIHLTYCLNVHRGETWDECLDAIRTHARAVRTRVAPDRRFGLGLRLSRTAAEELRDGDRLADFRRFLADEGMYVFTVNGFPYGRFHDEPVKTDVYRPDWRTGERRDYTMLLADILADLLPVGVAGSISTVPVSYRPWITGDDDVARAAGMIAETAGYLAAVRKRTGRDIRLALEPEPDCWVETTDELIAFATSPLQRHGVARLVELGYAEDDAAAILRHHVGACLDTAHLAVAFEDPVGSLGKLRAAGVGVAKIHLSAALRAEPGEPARRRLGDFADEVYLHQVKSRRTDGTLRTWADLPDALQEPGAADDGERRVHFHVPLFFESDGPLRSTADLLRGRFAAMLRDGACEHLEIETYTYDVLPDDVRPADLAESIAREYEWVLRELLAGA